LGYLLQQANERSNALQSDTSYPISPDDKETLKEFFKCLETGNSCSQVKWLRSVKTKMTRFVLAAAQKRGESTDNSAPPLFGPEMIHINKVFDDNSPLQHYVEHAYFLAGYLL
jgi:hypothetical protein